MKVMIFKMTKVNECCLQYLITHSYIDVILVFTGSARSSYKLQGQTNYRVMSDDGSNSTLSIYTCFYKATVSIHIIVPFRFSIMHLLWQLYSWCHCLDKGMCQKNSKLNVNIASQ